jgi:hypothetical protein
MLKCNSKTEEIQKKKMIKIEREKEDERR